MDYKIKIENRGKVEPEELEITENLIKHLYSATKGDFESISPKMFYILKKEEINEDELCGFEFTILSSSFKGRIEIRQTLTNKYNIYFYRRIPTKIKFTYEYYNKIENVDEKQILCKLEFCKEGDKRDFFVKKGDVVMLNSGYACIIKKYYSNIKIGVVYDEESEEIEDYITKEDILKRLR